MAQKENIDILLLYIRKLEEAVTTMKGTEFYPASFFDQTMELTSRIMGELHLIEANQIETLQKQLEAHQALLDSVTRKERIVSPIVKGQDKNVQPAVQPQKSAEQPHDSSPVAEPKVEEIQQNVPTQQQEELKVQPMAAKAQPQEIHLQEEKKISPVEKTVLQPKTYPVQTPTVSKTAEQRPGLFLNDILEKKNLADFKKAFSLNDRFRFRRELFSNNEKAMEQAINDLNAIQSYEASINYLNSELKWDMENQAVKDFMLLLEKRFL